VLSLIVVGMTRLLIVVRVGRLHWHGQVFGTGRYRRAAFLTTLGVGPTNEPTLRAFCSIHCPSSFRRNCIGGFSGQPPDNEMGRSRSLRVFRTSLAAELSLRIGASRWLKSVRQNLNSIIMGRSENGQ